MKTTKVNEYDKETGERCIAKITFDEEDLREIVHKTLENNDFVQVVRCKDCKWFNLNKWAEVDGVQIIVGHEICDFWGGGCKTQKDGYCNYGERKEQEHE